MKNSRQNRIEYFDFLRIGATLAVIVIHVVVLHWYQLDVGSAAWHGYAVFSCGVRWAVPMFLMMSGALFIGSSRSWRVILKKNVFRLLTALVFWSAVYALVEYATKGLSLGEAVFAFVLGHFHLWFLYVLVGLYLAVPLLRKIAESAEILGYFLVLALLFSCVAPQVISWVGLFSRTGEHLLSEVLGQFEYTFATRCSFYFMLGYWLQGREFSPVWRKRIYVLGILGLVLTYVLTAAISVWKQELQECFIAYHSLNALCTSVAVFVFGKYNLSYGRVRPGIAKWVCALSKYSFGAYLVHILMMNAAVQVFPLNRMEVSSFFFVPVVSVTVFALSMAVSWLLHQVPVLKKYIV